MGLVADLRAGLRDNLKNIDGVQVSRYMLVDPTPPGIHILPPSTTYHQAMHAGKTDYVFTIQAFVSPSVEPGGQMVLDELLAETGSRSVCAAVESDQTLGGVADAVVCTEASQPRFLVTSDQRVLLTSDWSVTVWV